MIVVSYPRRQRRHRLACAAGQALLGVTALLLAAAAVDARLIGIAAVLGLLAVISTRQARRSLGLARRSAIGARSEDRVRSQLRLLEREGWRVRHSLRWQGGGDIDHVAAAPRGLPFAIETKTRAYTRADLERIAAIAARLGHRRGGWWRDGATPVLCLVHPHGVERAEAGVVVVSVERLVPVLRRLSGTTPKPGFLR